MNAITSIRKRLGMTQAEFAAAIKVSQGSVSHIETGRQAVSPAVAGRIIQTASQRGIGVTYDDIYNNLQESA
ncbi:helix-turn-helix transcriptional regulator [Thauera sp.]|uniref:helix-turn-helix transcriptional regulator n=1 Tax=Thauera sp. TaxID=1905334 RepID=UPI0039E4A2B6